MGAILKGAKNSFPAADSEDGQSAAIYSNPNVFFYFLEMMSLAQLREMFLISKAVRELSVEKLRGLVLLVGERESKGIAVPASSTQKRKEVWADRKPFGEGMLVQESEVWSDGKGDGGGNWSGTDRLAGRGVPAPPSRVKKKDAAEMLLFSSVLSEIEEFEAGADKKKIVEKLAEVYGKEKLTPELLPTALLLIEEEMVFGGLGEGDIFGSGPPGASAQMVMASKDGRVVFAPLRQMLYHYFGRHPGEMERLVMGVAKNRDGGEPAEEIKKMKKALGRERFAKEMAGRLRRKEFDDFCMFADKAGKRVYVCRMFCTKAILKKAAALSKKLFG